MFNPHPCQSLLMMNQNLKSLKSLTPRLTTIDMPASYCILSVGQGMRALMKKLPGYSLLNSDMLPNLSQISIPPTQPSLALFHIFEPGNFIHYLRFTCSIANKSLLLSGYFTSCFPFWVSKLLH